MLSAYAKVVWEGEDVTLYCDSTIPWYDIVSAPTYRWYDVNGDLIYDYTGSIACYRCVSHMNGGNHELTLRHITVDDEGEYICYQSEPPSQTTYIEVKGEYSAKHCNCQNKYHLLHVS